MKKKEKNLDFNLFKELNNKNISSEKSFFAFSKNNFEIFIDEKFLSKKELQIKYEEQKNENEALNKEIYKLKKDLFSIQESRIWRYSYQFRRLIDKLRN